MLYAGLGAEVKVRSCGSTVSRRLVRNSVSYSHRSATSSLLCVVGSIKAPYAAPRHKMKSQLTCESAPTYPEEQRVKDPVRLSKLSPF